jgi:hypothetical protein
MSATLRWYRTCFSTLFTLLLIGIPGISGAKSLNQNVHGNLGGGWWEWAFNTAFSQFDFDDDGVVDCSDGQSGGVWYLAGTFGGPDERSCTIPTGKRLFFPLVNTAFFYEEGVDDVVWNLTTEERRIYMDGRIGGGSLATPQAVADLAAYTGDISTVSCDLHATLDGEPLAFTTSIVRAQSGFTTISTENLGDPTGLPDEEALADGFWVLIGPLAAGEYTLEYGGAFCDVTNLESRTFETNVIYHITVEAPRGRFLLGF